MREISIQKINRVCCGLSPVCNKICNYAPTINYTLVRCLQTLCATTHPTRAWNDAVWRCKTEAFLACPWNVNELPRTKWHVPTQNITTFSDDSSFLVSQTHAPLSLSLSLRLRSHLLNLCVICVWNLICCCNNVILGLRIVLSHGGATQSLVQNGRDRKRSLSV